MAGVLVSAPVVRLMVGKQRAYRIGGNAGALEIGVQIAFEIVVTRHFVALAAFLAQAS
jgi:hypothetical protein